MSVKATDYKFTWLVLRDARAHEEPNLTSKYGVVAAGQFVYSNESPVEKADRYLWMHTTVGWIRGDLLKLEYHIAPTPTTPLPTPSTPAELVTMIAEVDSMIVRLTMLRAMLERYGK